MKIFKLMKLKTPEGGLVCLAVETPRTSTELSFFPFLPGLCFPSCGRLCCRGPKTGAAVPDLTLVLPASAQWEHGYLLCRVPSRYLTAS